MKPDNQQSKIMRRQIIYLIHLTALILPYDSVLFEQKPAMIPTKLNGHKVPCGSVLSYQLSLTEANFNVLTNFPVLQRPRTVGDYFPDLPIETTGVGLQMPLSYLEDWFISHLKVPNPSLIERETRGQGNNPFWFQSRRLRLTSSNFGLVCNRKLNIPYFLN